MTSDNARRRSNRGAISPASIVASLVIFRIVCIGTYSILCDFGAYTNFYANIVFMLSNLVLSLFAVLVITLDMSRLVPAILILSILRSSSLLQ